MRKGAYVSIFALAATFMVSAVHPARGNPSSPQAEDLKLTNAQLPEGKIGHQYYCVVTGSGGRKPYDFSATGLPPGITLGEGKYLHDTLMGKPTQAGMWSVVLKVADQSRPTPLTASATLTLKLVPDDAK